MRLVASLAMAGLGRQPVRWLVLALGVLVASAFPVIAGGFRVSAESAAVRAAVDGIPETDRSVVMVSGRTFTPAESTDLNTQVDQRYAAAGLTDVRRYLAFRPLTSNGSDFTLAAFDDLSTAVRLTGGALPTSCEPQRCEVLVTSPGGDLEIDVAALTAAAQPLGVVVTGTAELLDTQPVNAGIVSTDQPMLVGGSVDAMNQLASVALRGRTIGWISPLDGDVVATTGVTEFGSELSSITDSLNLAFRGGLALRWPSDQIAAAADRAVQSARRFSLLGATGAALQLGFCLAAAVGMRTRQRQVARLLDRRGASPVQITAVPLVQAGVTVVVGTAVGLAAGFAAVAIAAGAGPPAGWAVAGDAFALAWPTVIALAVAAVVLAVAVIRWPADAALGTRIALDALLVVAVGVTVLAVSRDPAGAAPDDPLTLSVLTLMALAAGLGTARCWPLVAGATRRLLRGRSSLPTRLAVLGGERRALRPSVTAGFLAAAICAVVFAGAYRTTLQESAADQAAYQVPLDVSVGTSRAVSNPLTVLDVGAIQSIDPAISVTPVTSTAVGVASGTPAAVSMPLIGVDRSQFTAMHRFAQTTGADVSADELAAALAPAPAAAASADGRPQVPTGHHQIDLAVDDMSPDVELSLWLTTDVGGQIQVQLTGSGVDGQTGSAVQTGSVDLDRPARITAVEISETDFHRTARLHGDGEGPVVNALPSGQLYLGAVTVDRTDLDQRWAGWGSDQVTAAPPDGGGRLPVGYQIGDTRAVITPDYVPRAQLAPLPVAADPATAALAHDGALTISIGGITMPATVAAVLPRMPTAAARFLLADREAVAALVDRVAPGTDPVSQVWIGTPDDDLAAIRAALTGPPVDTASIVVRTDVEAALRADPVATRTADLLALAALIAMILSAVALAMAILADRAEEADDLVAWELDGLPPVALRRVLLRRTLLVAVAGVPLGVVGGWLLAVVAVQLISVGAAGAATMPPLQLAVGWGWITVVVVSALFVGVAAASATALLSLREPLPRLPEQDLR